MPAFTKRLSRAAFGACLVLAAIAFSGCIAIKEESASQRAAGAVTLHVKICANDQDGTRYQDCKPATAGSTAENDNGQDVIAPSPLPGNGQVFIGFRVPDGTGAPASFRNDDGRLTFAQSPGYSDALTAEYVPVAGFHWVGYLSTGTISFDGTNPANFVITVDPEFILPTGPGGTPFAGPFRWRPVIGTRGVSASSPADAPVDCAVGSLFCFDSPPPSTTTGRATIANLSTALVVSDFAVRAPDALSAPPGQTATLTYRLSNQDAANRGAPTLTLKATTTIPGAQPQLGATVIAIPRNASTTATVTLPVPPGTPVGTYDVVLTATGNSVPAGADIPKSATAKLTVVDKTAPAIRVSSPGDTTYSVGQGVTADYGCTDEAGGSGVASCAGPVPSGAAIDTSTPGTFDFTVTGKDNAGNSASASKSYTVAAPPPPPPVVVASVPPGRVNVTLAFLFPSAAASTKFTVLQVKGVPSGSTVVATCKGGGCPTKKVKGKKQNVVFTKKNASGTVNLTPFRNKALRAGAVLTVTVTKPGSFGMVKTLAVKKNKKPILSTSCLQPNSSTAKASCSS
ncbi:hypothetical protein OM076_02565 [Solirubrobacter ginsenosidimutans]|uniref:HYR domain-containing protein n=1 Tax=Solirubrobacter ginsenosidimutans TaxID=490573 RepID=A0A9X3RY08_9ACTN|nr:hypothetical protein [Solirubrobacter ginsenosidimutans]MDA0159135.1 hypothetical protein [Solirubrobacter ginsenosidimutans]